MLYWDVQSVIADVVTLYIKSIVPVYVLLHLLEQTWENGKEELNSLKFYLRWVTVKAVDTTLSKQAALSKPLILHGEMCACNVAMEKDVHAAGFFYRLFMSEPSGFVYLGMSWETWANLVAMQLFIPTVAAADGGEKAKMLQNITD